MSPAHGFMLADSAVFDQAEWDAYRAVVAPSVERHGGCFIIHCGRIQRIEGERERQRLVEGVTAPA